MFLEFKIPARVFYILLLLFLFLTLHRDCLDHQFGIIPVSLRHVTLLLVVRILVALLHAFRDLQTLELPQSVATQLILRIGLLVQGMLMLFVIALVAFPITWLF